MTQTKRFPLSGCKNLTFSMVLDEVDAERDFWVFECEKEECATWRRMGGPSKSCLTDPFETIIGEDDGDAGTEKNDAGA